MATFITTMRFTEHQTLGRLALVNLGRRHKPEAPAKGCLLQRRECGHVHGEPGKDGVTEQACLPVNLSGLDRPPAPNPPRTGIQSQVYKVQQEQNEEDDQD